MPRRSLAPRAHERPARRSMRAGQNARPFCAFLLEYDARRSIAHCIRDGGPEDTAASAEPARAARKANACRGLARAHAPGPQCMQQQHENCVTRSRDRSQDAGAQPPPLGNLAACRAHAAATRFAGRDRGPRRRGAHDASAASRRISRGSRSSRDVHLRAKQWARRRARAHDAREPRRGGTRGRFCARSAWCLLPIAWTIFTVSSVRRWRRGSRSCPTAGTTRPSHTSARSSGASGSWHSTKTRERPMSPSS